MLARQLASTVHTTHSYADMLCMRATVTYAGQYMDIATSNFLKVQAGCSNVGGTNSIRQAEHEVCYVRLSLHTGDVCKVQMRP